MLIHPKFPRDSVVKYPLSFHLTNILLLTYFLTESVKLR